MTLTTRTFILANPPVANVDLGEGENATFKLVTRSVPELEHGQVLVRNIYLSNDPSQRAWIQKGLRADRMYVKPVTKGEVMRSVGLAQVVELKSPKYVAGDILNAEVEWSEYLVVTDEAVFNKINDQSVPLPLYLDVLGFTGLTAYFGLFKVALLKPTDTIVISAALGATGSTCVQIAKNIFGCRVIGISGGSAKCEYVRLLGADECVDYKSPTFGRDLLKALGKKKFCDVFFDGVGGKVLDMMLNFVKPYGEVIACGSVTSYNDPANSGLRNWGQITTNRLHVKGFIVLDYEKEFSRGVADLAQWIKEGRIKYDNSTYSLIDLTKKKDGFRFVPQTWGILFSEKKSPGKLVTKVAEVKSVAKL